jgi:hypothetical protein
VKNKHEVIKHSAAVHIQNNITLLQRRAWNVLLANAYDELPRQEVHTILIKDLMQVLEYGSKNETYLKEALEALVGCKVKWNVLDKDNQWEWGVTTLLAQAKIKSGICTYAYSPELRQRLHNPTMYARISLSLQNKFDSRHAQALWELCVDYLGASRQYGETPFIPIGTYRDLMGIPPDMYPQFKRFNQRVIKEPVDEINRVTDFQMTVEYQRQDRKVSGVKFRIRRVLAIPPENRTLPMFPEIEDMPEVVRELKIAGLPPQDAWNVWQKGFDVVEVEKRPEVKGKDVDAAFLYYIREKIDLLKRRQAFGKVGNSTGFLLESIRKNYSNPEFAEAEKQKDVQKKREERQARERKLEKLQEEKIRIEKERRDEAHRVCEKIIVASPAVIEQAVSVLLEEKSTLKSMYEPCKTPMENYQERFLLQIEIDAYLEQLYPERFQTIREIYDPQFATVDQKIDALR